MLSSSWPSRSMHTTAPLDTMSPRPFAVSSRSGTPDELKVHCTPVSKQRISEQQTQQIGILEKKVEVLKIEEPAVGINLFLSHMAAMLCLGYTNCSATAEPRKSLLCPSIFAVAGDHYSA